MEDNMVKLKLAEVANPTQKHEMVNITKFVLFFRNYSGKTGLSDRPKYLIMF